MRNTYQDFERRTAALEQICCPPVASGVSYLVKLEPAALAGLTPEQRIVEDEYKNMEGKTVMSMERIAADAFDIGQCFPHGCWSGEALSEYHCPRSAPKDIRITYRIAKPQAVSQAPPTRPRRPPNSGLLIAAEQERLGACQIDRVLDPDLNVPGSGAADLTHVPREPLL